MPNEQERTDMTARASADAAAMLAQATADAARVLAQATARAAASVDEERNRKIDVMFDRSERLETAIFGNGRPGLIDEVTTLNTKMKFGAWVASTLALSIVGIVTKLVVLR